MRRWAVFVSGEGTNLQNFLDLEKTELKNNSIAAVHADRPCRGIERAMSANKPTLILSPKADDFIPSLMKFLAEHAVDSIFLLGYMRILSKEFFEKWKKPVVNLHPSLLPKYPGVNSIEKAFKANEKFLGVTLHEVTEGVDEGPILKQMQIARPPAVELAEMTELVHAYERKIVREYLLELDSSQK